MNTMHRMFATSVKSALIGKMVTDGKRDALIAGCFQTGAGQFFAIVDSNGAMEFIRLLADCPWSIKE